MTRKSWRPTNKWVVARITALAALSAMLLTGDPAITDAEIIAIIGVTSEAATSYFTRNDGTPEGVPVKGEAEGSGD